MSEGIGRRSSSFNVLRRDSPGDGEALISPVTDAATQGGNVHRKRRRHKNRKNNLSYSSLDSSIINSGLTGGSLSLTCSPASSPGGIYQSSATVYGVNALYQRELTTSVSCSEDRLSRLMEHPNGSMPSAREGSGEYGLVWPTPDAVSHNGFQHVKTGFRSNTSGVACASGSISDRLSTNSERQPYGNCVLQGSNDQLPVGYDQVVNEVAAATNGYISSTCRSVPDISAPGSSELKEIDGVHLSSPSNKSKLRHLIVHASADDLQSNQGSLDPELETVDPWETVNTNGSGLQTPQQIVRLLLQTDTAQLPDWEQPMAANSSFVPLRIIIFLWRVFGRKRQYQRLQAEELSDLGSLLVLVAGVTLLQQADISYIYHMIRSQATIKLYVVYNVLEIFDKLCQSFGSDVLQVVLNSAENVATCTSDRLLFESFRFAMDQCIAVVSFIAHSLIILAQSITVSAAIRSHNHALLTLLISNNFAEIKSNVFKRLTKDNIHKLAYLDTVERFHIIAHLFFVLAQNLLATKEPWLVAFAANAGMVLLCEILVDAIKHAFLAKFNEIKPVAYSDFLLALCKQTLTSLSHEVHNTMAFVPYAPACVVIRVLVPLYAAYIPAAPWWRFFCTVLYCMVTYSILIALKMLVGVGLLKHANWYIERYKKKEKYFHSD